MSGDRWLSWEELLIIFYNMNCQLFDRYVDIAKKFKQRYPECPKTVGAIERKIRRLRDEGMIAELSKESVRRRYETMSYDEQLEILSDFIKRKRKKISEKKIGNRKQRVIISDLHSPFVDWDAFAKFIHETKDIDQCTILGDGVDLYNLSSFRKEVEYFVTPEGEKVAPTISNELLIDFAVFEILCSNFASVDYVEGNHEARVRYYLAGKDVPLEFINVLMKGKHIVDIIGADFENLKKVGFEPSDEDRILGNSGYVINSFVRYGDLLGFHLEVSSNRAVGGQLNRVIMTIDNLGWGPLLGVTGETRVIAQAHSHNLLMGKYGRYWGIETGCLEHVRRYQMRRMYSYRFNQKGYVVITQDDEGRTDINRSRIYAL